MKKNLVKLNSLAIIKGVLNCNEWQIYKNDQFMCSQNRSIGPLFSPLKMTSQLNRRGFIPALVIQDKLEIKADKSID